MNNWFGNYKGIPSGCSVRNGRDHRLHFEESQEGVGRGRQDLIPLCRKAFSSIGMEFCYSLEKEYWNFFITYHDAKIYITIILSIMY